MELILIIGGLSALGALAALAVALHHTICIDRANAAARHAAGLHQALRHGGRSPNISGGVSKQ